MRVLAPHSTLPAEVTATNAVPLIPTADLSAFDAIGAEATSQLARLDGQALRRLFPETPEQPTGPFYPVRTRPDEDAFLVTPRSPASADGWTPGVWAFLGVFVTNAAGTPLQGIEVFLWQADHQGRYDHPEDPQQGKFPLVPNFQYWGRGFTDKDGRTHFITLMPGSYPADADWIRPPHYHLALRDDKGQVRLITQLYHEGHELNAQDLILNRLSDDERQRLMVGFETSNTTDVVDGIPADTMPATMLVGAKRLVI